MDIDVIAKYYGMWVASHPFDIGLTTRNSLNLVNGSPRPAATAIEETNKYN